MGIFIAVIPTFGSLYIGWRTSAGFLYRVSVLGIFVKRGFAIEVRLLNNVLMTEENLVCVF